MNKKFWQGFVFIVALLPVGNSALASKKDEPSKVSSRDRANYFLIEKVEGLVYYKMALGSLWRELKAKDRLPEGTLVQTTPESSFSYTFFAKGDSGWSGDQAYITIKSPLIFRLEPDILRDANLTEFHFERIPVIKSYHKREKFEEYFPFLKNAWDRISIFASKKENTQHYIQDLFEKAKEPIELGFRAKKIELMRPSHGSASVAISYPAPYQVLWKEPVEYDGEYDVHLWIGKGAKGQPVGSAYGNAFQVIVPAPESYYIQVTSKDGRFASDPHLIHFSEPMKKTKALARHMEKSSFLHELLPMYPPNRFNILSKGALQVDFYWRIENFETFADLFLVISNINTRSEKKFPLATYDVHRSVKLKPGKYAWWLVATKKQTSDSGVPKEIVSAQRALTVSKSSDRKVAARALSDFSKNKGTTRLYVEDLSSLFQGADSQR